MALKDARDCRTLIIPDLVAGSSFNTERQETFDFWAILPGNFTAGGLDHKLPRIKKERKKNSYLMTPSNFLRLLWYPVNSLVMAKSDQDLCLSRSASLGKQLTFSGSCPSGVGSSLQFFSLRCHVKILSLTSHFNLIRNCDFTSNRLIPLDYLPPM